MLISALYDYAQYIDGFAPDGYEMFTVTHRIVLAKDGTMTNIVDVRKEKEIAGVKGKAKKQLVPESHLFPLRNAKKENAYLLEHRGKYIFGLDLVKNELIAKDKCYKSFVEVNADFFEKIDSVICKAVAAFAKKYTPEDFIQDTRILDLGKEVATAHFGFCLEGLESPLEEDSAFKKAYSTHLAQQETGEDSAFCCITGETLPIETTHKGIKIPHSKVTITKLVSMNANAFCSYNRKQSLNSCISQKASTQYAKVLNYLLSDKNHHKMIGDLALVYFAMKKNDAPECNWFGEMMDVPDWMKEESSKEADASLNSQFQKTTEGRVSGINEEDLDKDATFYVIGLVARSARICVKFVWKDRFGELVDNLR